MNQQEWNNKLQKIGQEFTARYPSYIEYLQEYGAPEKADQMLTAQGILAENELLQIYCQFLDLVQDEEELKVPERFPQISSSFLIMNCCIPYSWDDENLCCLFAAPYNLPQILYELEEIYGRKTTFRLATPQGE